MCSTCGCGHAATGIETHSHDGATHHHDYAHHHSDAQEARRVQVEQDILGRNNAFAEQNRCYFRQHGIFALNLVSSPGAGKTALLTATIDALKPHYAVSVIEGDQQTQRDADRIRETGAGVIQINTGKGCHLDAHMVGHAVTELQPADDSVLMIENVGNLVCPAAFDLGEAHKVAVLSVTEGEDKPLKYPDMFYAADVMLINKTDLLPYVDFDVQQCIAYAREVNAGIRIIQLSAARSTNLGEWTEWIKQGLKQRRAA